MFTSGVFLPANTNLSVKFQIPSWSSTCTALLPLRKQSAPGGNHVGHRQRSAVWATSADQEARLYLGLHPDARPGHWREYGRLQRDECGPAKVAASC